MHLLWIQLFNFNKFIPGRIVLFLGINISGVCGSNTQRYKKIGIFQPCEESDGD